MNDLAKLSEADLATQDQLVERIGELIHELRQTILGNLEEVSKLLYQLDDIHYKQVKKLYGPLVGGADHIDRMKLFADGMPKYLALPFNKKIRASEYSRMSAKARKQVRDPEDSWPIATKRGVRYKKFIELNAMEWDQIYSPAGLLDPEQQREKIFPIDKPTKKEQKALDNNPYVFSSAKPSDKPGMLRMIWHEQDEPNNIIVGEIPLKTIRILCGHNT